MFWFLRTEIRITSSGSFEVSIVSGRSVLLSRIMRLVSWLISRSCLSCAVSGSLAFSTSRTKSASLRAFFERSTPICSTMSSVSRIPAVSINLRGTPLMLTYSSMTSRVVPAISVTIALSSRKRLLRRLDFPTLGRPMIAVEIPSRRILPRRAVLRRLVSNCSNSIVFSRTTAVVASSTSSYSG
ncbi:Uncharacterised protein [Streptococcus pneumoniae]|nr:Uncharacterised protein [Streptococcus pneumoniae]CIX64838.1 Uncharacterised protein [Streptococcus pneumoniae]VJI61512.1 Uncharacterised protein [Streptococcus pneumoniae]